MSRFDGSIHQRRAVGERLLRQQGFPRFNPRKIPWVTETAKYFSTAREITGKVGIFGYDESLKPNASKDRTFVYRRGRGKDFLPHDKNQTEKPTFFRFSELSIVSHHSPLIRIFQRRFNGGEYDLYIDVTAVPEGEPKENDFAEMTVRYYPDGHREVLEQGLGTKDERQTLLQAGFPVLSSLPEKINFKQTLKALIDQAINLDFSNPHLSERKKK